MKPSEPDRHASEPQQVKGTTGEQVGHPEKRPRKVPDEKQDPTSRYQKKTGQIKRDFGR